VIEPYERQRDLTAAIVLAVIVFLIFAGLVAGILTDTFPPTNSAVAWVGTGLVGVASAIFSAWAVVLQIDARMEWADRLGGDVLLVGVAVGVVLFGLGTFAAGVL
jgi:hypothetical protein